MSKLFWNTLKLSPVILGATLLLANRVPAAEATVSQSFTVLPAKLLLPEPVANSVQVDAQSSLNPANDSANCPKPVESSVSQPENTQAPELTQETSVSSCLPEARARHICFPTVGRAAYRLGIQALQSG